MKIYLLSLFFLFFLAQPTLKAQPLSVIDTIWGTPVADPYRWLEDLNSDTVKEWLKQQKKLTKIEQKKSSAAFSNINEKITRDGGASFPKFIKQGPYYFRLMYNSEFSTPVLYYKKRANADLWVAYDTHDFMKEPVSIEGFQLSNDARLLAVSLSKAGTDWRTIQVRDLKTKKTLPDKIEWVKFSNIVWADSGFFYSRFKEPPPDLVHIASNTQQQLCFHKLGDAQEKDAVIYSIPNEANSIFNFHTVAKNRYLILYTTAKLKGRWYNVILYKDLMSGIFAEGNILITTPAKDDIDFSVVACIKDKFLIHTNLDAPHYRVLSCHKDSMNRMEEFIPEFTETLESIQHGNGKLLALYFNKGRYVASFYDYEGDMIQGIKFQEGWNLDGFYGGESDSVVDYSINSFYTPPIVYSLNLNTYKSELVEKTTVHYDAERYNTKLVTYKSKDGTEIPMYITHKKNLVRSRKNPVLLYGYGGFGIPITPFYSFSNILFFENDGVLAVPMIRGGGELGKEWHKNGSGLNKQNSFDDFASAAEYLINNNYTTKEKLAIRGGSNGGLLVGAMITQHPGLFKVAISDVGVFDMLRYHLFTMGRLWEDEYGTLKDSVQFQNLYKYSPLHNIKPHKDYPATLLLTAKNDDRVPPLHTYKFLQALQDNSFGKDPKPHILYFEKDAGHSGAETINEIYQRESFIWAFIFNEMGILPYTHF